MKLRLTNRAIRKAHGEVKKPRQYDIAIKGFGYRRDSLSWVEMINHSGEIAGRGDSHGSYRMYCTSEACNPDPDLGYSRKYGDLKPGTIKKVPNYVDFCPDCDAPLEARKVGPTHKAGPPPIWGKKMKFECSECKKRFKNYVLCRRHLRIRHGLTRGF